MRTVNVNSQSQFNEALANAAPGDHIVLANGSYTGPGTWTKNGTQPAPIVVRAANLLGATISGSFNPNGTDLILYGLDFPNSSCNPGNSRSTQRIKIWRCRFRDRPAPSQNIALRTYNVQDIDIAYCEWTEWYGRGISTGIAAGTRNFTIRRCLFRRTQTNRNSDGRQNNATEALQIGFGDADAAINANGRVEYNRFVGWSSDDEVISGKTSNVVYYRNTMEDCLGGISNRMGQNNRYEANRLINSGGLSSWDANNLYLGNQQTGAPSGFPVTSYVYVADRAAGSYTGTNKFNQSLNCVFSGNRLSGTLVIGRDPSWITANYPARGTRVRDHLGGISLGTHTGTDSQPGSSETLYSWDSPVYLNNSDVGPHANGIDDINNSEPNDDNSSSESSQQQDEPHQSNGSDSGSPQPQQGANTPESGSSNNSDGCSVDSAPQQQPPTKNTFTDTAANECSGDPEKILQQYSGENAWDVAMKYRRKAHASFVEMSKHPVGSNAYSEHQIRYRACDAIHDRALEIARSSGTIR